MSSSASPHLPSLSSSSLSSFHSSRLLPFRHKHILPPTTPHHARHCRKERCFSHISSSHCSVRSPFNTFVMASSDGAKRVVPYANYVVPIDDSAGSSFITRPLAEILRDMNRRVPDKVVGDKIGEDGKLTRFIPWYHANRMLSFYAPGWSGEVRSISFSPDGKKVSVVYRVTLRGSDGEAHREASGTASLDDIQGVDPVQQAEGIAFSRACARFGLGLYLYHEDETQE